jgi:hypothetical protein
MFFSQWVFEFYQKVIILHPLSNKFRILWLYQPSTNIPEWQPGIWCSNYQTYSLIYSTTESNHQVPPVIG